VTVLIGANLAATVIRFVIYRHWVFRRRRPAADALASPALPDRALPAEVPQATVLPANEPSATVLRLTSQPNGLHQ
jgi:hypothetical protein